MLRSLLRRSAVLALGLAAVLFSVLGTQPAPAAAADIFSNVGCSYGDYSCYYSKTQPGYGYPQTYQPYGYNYGYGNSYPYVGYNYTQPAYSYASYSYTPSYYGYSNYGYNNAYVPSYASTPYYNGYYYGYQYGGVPNRIFTAVGCNVGNYTCLRSK